jgi:hypothetical protein
LANCLLTQNSAPNGGALYVPGGTATLTNCTLTRNASPAGGATHIVGGEATIDNCIVWGNEEPVFAEVLPTVTYSDVPGGFPGPGNIDADPLFVDPDGPDGDPNSWRDNDYRLSAGSPCIDAGDNGAVARDEFDLDDDGDPDEMIPFDLGDNPRCVDDPGMVDDGLGTPPLIDMGAYEFQGATCFGDLDGDDDIDLGDLATLLAHYESTGTVYSDGDLDRDEDVDLADLAALLAVYETTCE